MARLYGKATKFIRHNSEADFELEPQRFHLSSLWYCNTGATARTDGQDLNNSVACPLGSKITKHKMEILIEPKTIEPQQIYIGRLKLSYNDILARPICGGMFDQASYQDTATEDFDVDTNAISPELYPDADSLSVQGPDTNNKEIGGSGSGYGILEWKLDDNIHHFINLKKLTVFDQRPLMGERVQKIPSKVKRINPFTYYGLFFFNDSPRGATAADTAVRINIKSYFEEWAI